VSFNSDAEIALVGTALVDRTLPKADWSHAAHFAAAIWMLTEDGVDAFADMPGFIRAYNEATGTLNTDTEGYHETITLASLKAAKHMIDAAPSDQPRCETLNALLASAFGQSDWMLTYWSRACLFSVKARRTWVAPDIAPLPF